MHSSMINPFSLEKDNKSFFMSLRQQSAGSISVNKSLLEDNKSRIRNMNKQLEELAKKKQQMLFKDSQMKYIFSKQRPSISIQSFVQGPYKNQKKFRVRQLLKEKKQSIHDFINKKKQIYLAKMSIDIKKQETQKLANSINEQKQQLKSRRLYFQNDLEFMKKFIDSLKKQTHDAQNALEEQMKTSEQINTRINHLDSQLQKYDFSIDRQQQNLDLLKKYQQFIQKLYNPDRGWKNYVPNMMKYDQVLFMTQKGADYSNIVQNDDMSLMIKYQPANMIELFLEAQQVNFRKMQNLQEDQYELNEIRKQYNKQKNGYDEIQKEYIQKINALQQNIEKRVNTLSGLNNSQSNNKKIQIIDKQVLDIDKLKSKLTQIYKSLGEESTKNNRPVQIRYKDMMTDIQVNFSDISKQINELKSIYPNLVSQVNSEYSKKLKKDHIEKKKQQYLNQQLSKKLQQQKKKIIGDHERFKGRKDMEKILVNRQEKKKKKIVVEKKDQDSIYFEDETQI